MWDVKTFCMCSTSMCLGVTCDLSDNDIFLILCTNHKETFTQINNSLSWVLWYRGAAYVSYSVCFHIPVSHRNTKSHHCPMKVKFSMIDVYPARQSGEPQNQVFLIDWSGSRSPLPTGDFSSSLLCKIHGWPCTHVLVLKEKCRFSCMH